MLAAFRMAEFRSLKPAARKRYVARIIIIQERRLNLIEISIHANGVVSL